MNGVKDGSFVRYHQNGQKSFETRIVNGKQVGIATSWDDSGKVLSRFEHTEDGKRINLLETTPAEGGEAPPIPPGGSGPE